jgi:2'-5' RNA ligase
MGIGVFLYLDAASEDKIKMLWQKMAEKKIDAKLLDSGIRPHISLGALHEVALDLVESRVGAFVKGLSAFKLSFASLGIFNTEGTVFLAPKVTEELIVLHRQFHGLFEEGNSDAFPYYLPERWVPHCSIAVGLSKSRVYQAVELLYDDFQPFEITVTEIGVTEFWPVTQRAVYRLSGLD